MAVPCSRAVPHMQLTWPCTLYSVRPLLPVLNVDMLTLRVHMLHYAWTLRQPGSSLLLGQVSSVSSWPVSMTHRDAQPHAVPSGCPARLRAGRTWGRVLATWQVVPRFYANTLFASSEPLEHNLHLSMWLYYIFHLKPQPGSVASAGYRDAAEHSKYVSVDDMCIVPHPPPPASGLLSVVLTTQHMPNQRSPRAPASLRLSLSEPCSWVTSPPPMSHPTSLEL